MEINYLCPKCNKIGYKSEAKNMCEQCEEDILIECSPPRKVKGYNKTEFDREFARILSEAW